MTAVGQCRAFVAGSGAEPLVSIVVPTYNRVGMVTRALDSCLEQTYRTIEVVVVNDGSTDDTAEVLNRYACRDPRVRVLHKANEGIADTLNCGHDLATGKYVTWTSDDNLFYPQAIGVMVDYLESHPDIDMVYADALSIDSEDRVIGEVHAPEPDVMARRDFLQAAVLYRKEVYTSVGGYRREWVRCQDWDFYIRAHQRFKIGRIPRVLYFYRWHANSMSGNHIEHVRESCRLLCSFEENRARRWEIWQQGYAEMAHSMRRSGRLWMAAWYELRSRRFMLQGLPRACDDAWRAAYQAWVPECIKTLWRQAKRSIAEGG